MTALNVSEAIAAAEIQLVAGVELVADETDVVLSSAMRAAVSEETADGGFSPRASSRICDFRSRRFSP